MIVKIIDEILLGFKADPADSEFQRGYQQALIDLRNRLIKQNQ